MAITNADTQAGIWISGWGFASDKSTDLEYLKSCSESQIRVILLTRIANSLEALRCPNFKDIPSRLANIELAIERLRKHKCHRKHAARKARRMKP